MTTITLAILSGVIALVFGALMFRKVLSHGQGTDFMQEIGQAIREGSMAFLLREYKVLIPFVVVVFFVLAIVIDWVDLAADPIVWSIGVPEPAISYLIGTIASGLTGFVGMQIAMRANTRSAAAAMDGLNQGLRVAFNSGSVMGISVVGVGILGVTLLWLVFKDYSVVAGFSFGASSIALFARVGGGIYPTAADVGADVVGKVEKHIPEDDPRNPATIADNVGDNVGDVAGMGADLFESYVGAIIASIALAGALAVSNGQIADASNIAWDDSLIVLPLLVSAAGIIASILGTFMVRTGDTISFSGLLWALRKGVFFSSGLIVIASAGAVAYLGIEWSIFWCILSGLIGGVIVGLATEYYTSYDYKPTQEVAESAQTGTGTLIISGMATAMYSTLIPVLVVGIAILISFELAGFYGVAIAGVGMLSTLGITLATDAYGPVADNAGGIATQADLDPEVRERTDALDSLGNTTAATGKGFAIGAAALTALALMAAFAVATGEDPKSFTLLEGPMILGLLLGALMPYFFSALTMRAVGSAAFKMVNEIRRQFKEKPGIMDRTERPDYAKCVEITTQASLKYMIMPGAIAVIVPLAVGFLLGVQALAGLLIGSIASGFLLAITMANAGGTWDNAKKYIELGNFGGKGSLAHEAGVVGDVVGDPFKDTSGPSMNILLKLMSVVSLVFAPAIAAVGGILF